MMAVVCNGGSFSLLKKKSWPVQSGGMIDYFIRLWISYFRLKFTRLKNNVCLCQL